jgi:hypothetical protein
MLRPRSPCDHPRMKRLALPALITAMSLLSASPAYAISDDTVPPPVQPLNMALTVTGNGCPKPTATPRPSLDNTYFQIDYTAMIAQAGANTRPTDLRVNCEARVQLFDIPPGYRYAITGLSVHLYSSLAAGSSGLLRTAGYFAGTPLPALDRHVIENSGEWTMEVPMIAESPDCDPLHSVNLDTELRVTPPSNRLDTSYLALAGGKDQLSTRYHIAWHKC